MLKCSLDEYKSQFNEFIDNLQNTHPVAIETAKGDARGIVKGYFQSHMIRFKTLIELLEKQQINEKNILEVGSPYPFVGFYFYKYYNCTVTVSDLFPRTWKINDKLKFKKINLCTETIDESYDVIICSEVFEHLPCNLIKVRDMIVHSIKKRGYGLFSFPLKSKAKIPLDEDIKNKDLNEAHTHLREFRGLVDDFMKNLNILERKIKNIEGYSGEIEMLIFKRSDKE